jgi:putative hydrolase of the HAD superfamily
VTGSARDIRGVITDWGGVLTNPIADAVFAWLDAEQIDGSSYTGVIGPWIQLAYAGDGGECPVHALERGELAETEFEELLAAELVTATGGTVRAAGLLRRMFAGSIVDQDMHALVRQCRGAGLRSGLLSNSWGRQAYPRHLFIELFDDVVISCEVGMRKPEERIFLLAAGRLGLAPAECVFIDDTGGNVAAAAALGFAVVHHADAVATRRALVALGVPLPGEPAGNGSRAGETPGGGPDPGTEPARAG